MRIRNSSTSPLPVGSVVIAPGAIETVDAANVAKGGAVVAAWFKARLLKEVAEVAEEPSEWTAEPAADPDPIIEEESAVRRGLFGIFGRGEGDSASE